MKKNKLFVLFLLFFGVLFRIIYPGNIGVGIDQVQILEKANQIIGGDLSLIGPRTGPANMFTGPLIYYLSVPFILIFGDYFAVPLVPMFLSLLTGISIYYLVRRYIGNIEAVISSIIWSFSPFLVSLDRVFWNPNLTLLSSFLVFIPILKKVDDKLSLLFLFLGAFLSYQSHFSGLVLLILAFVTLAFRKSIKPILSLILGFSLSIIPTVLFDVRNDFLNLKGLIFLFGEKGELNFISLAKDFFHNFYVVSETQGKLFLYGNSTELIISLGFLFIVAFFILAKKHKESMLPIIWILSISLIYSFYGGEKPEYYFLIILPSLFIISTRIIRSINLDFQKSFFLLFAITSIFINNKNLIRNSGFTVKNISNIQKILSQKNVRKIVYDVPYGSDVGIKYFLNSINLKESGDVYHVSFPNDISFNGIQKISDIALWKDARTENNNYIAKNHYFLETGKQLFLYENSYPKNEIQSFDSYKIISNDLVVGEIHVAQENKDKLGWVQECIKQKELKNYEWVFDENKYIKYSSAHCLLLLPKEGFSTDLSTISIW